MTGLGTTPEQLATPESVRHLAADRLGQFASYLTTVSSRLRTGQGTVDDLLAVEHVVRDTLAVLTLEDQICDDDVRAVLAQPNLADSGRLDPDTYPDIRFYRGIIAEFPEPGSEVDETAATIHIIDNWHIRGDDAVEFKLTGELSYMFNALLHHRLAPVSAEAVMQHGFRQSPSPNTTKFRFNVAMRTLSKALANLLPSDVEPVLIVTGPYLRQLNPAIRIVDERTTREDADRPRPGLTLAGIARITGRQIRTVEARVTQGEWKTLFTGPGGVEIFPQEVSEAIVARCQMRRPQKIAQPAPVVTATTEVPSMSALVAAELENLDPLPVEPKPEPAVAPPAELSKYRDLMATLPRLSSMADTLRFLRTELGGHITEQQIKGATARDLKIQPVYSTDMQPQFPPYAVRRLLAALSPPSE